MQVVKSNLTGRQIKDGTIRYAIPLYLKSGETAEGMIKKHNGDLDKTIKFLRDRSYEDIEVIKKKEKASKKKKGTKNHKPKSGSQKNLF